MAEELTQIVTAEPERDSPSIFIGAHGIRAGWSALIFIAIFLALEFIAALPIFTFIHFRVEQGAPQPAHVALIQEMVQVCLVMLTTFIMSRIERRPVAVYGYAGKARLIRFLSGLLWGFAAISVLVAALWKSHLLAFDGTPLGGPLAWKYAMEWAVAFVFVGIFEESLLRGYLQYTLTRGLGFWWGALILSTTFGAIHGSNPGESPVGLFAAAAIGLVFCLSLWYTGSLWWAIGFHAAWDWGETYFYGTSDSGMVAAGHLFSEHPTGPLLWTGGATGPEGSLLVVPLILVIALLMWLWWGRRTVSPFRKQVPSATES
ncbi:CPBP family intramembrane metalloprotease [Alloacidobacterium dinghuense]|uniref:CPBP family intramembrane metalloprotease n=1 Tax=Alloacidobacterium dinghuense TaxID=2763107 RepID=A0A7G8BLB9_9BACT|nr:type II CAAX endopeptidase family protein [Alloacidobacterium dinghuense]QNI33339.1 CPBP family intramembrane metalloprotease [Alloacidobacterium dinghuense]